MIGHNLLSPDEMLMPYLGIYETTVVKICHQNPVSLNAPEQVVGFLESMVHGKGKGTGKGTGKGATGTFRCYACKSD